MAFVTNERHGAESRRAGLYLASTLAGGDGGRGASPILLIELHRNGRGRRGGCRGVERGKRRDHVNGDQVPLVSGRVVEGPQGIAAAVFDWQNQPKPERTTTGTGAGGGVVPGVTLRVKRAFGVGQILVERVELVAGDGGNDRLAGGIVELDLANNLPWAICGKRHVCRVAGGGQSHVENQRFKIGVRLKGNLVLLAGRVCAGGIAHGCQSRTPSERDSGGRGRLAGHGRTAEVGRGRCGTRGTDTSRCGGGHGHLLYLPGIRTGQELPGRMRGRENGRPTP